MGRGMLQCTIYKTYCVKCSICGEEYATDRDAAKEAREAAKEKGFKRVNGQNLCPKCQGK